jgi:hypothetical protein
LFSDCFSILVNDENFCAGVKATFMALYCQEGGERDAQTEPPEEAAAEQEAAEGDLPRR